MVLTYNMAGRLRLSFQEESLSSECQLLSIKILLQYFRFVTRVAFSSVTFRGIIVSPPSPCGSGDNLVGRKMATRSIIHDHLMPRFIMTIATPLLLLSTYMACSEETFTFTFTFYLVTIHVFYVFRRWICFFLSVFVALVDMCLGVSWLLWHLWPHFPAFIVFITSPLG